MRLANHIWHQETGDTIIEVLVAIAVVSLVLVGAYSSVNHSTLSTQDSQEHIQALKLIQSQVEFLRATGTFTPPGCFSATGSINSPANCSFTAGGVACGSVQPCYIIAISRTSASSPYAIQASWSTILISTPNASETLYYRPVVLAP